MSVTKTKIDGWLTDAKKTYTDAVAKGETPSNNYIHHLISPNLWLRITPKSGKAVFVYRVTIKNYVPEIAITKRKLKPSNVYNNWYTIGEYPHVSLADANHKAKKCAEQVANGINPCEVDKKKYLQQITIGEVFNRWFDDKKPTITKNSIIDHNTFFNAHLSKIAQFPIDKLSVMLVNQYILDPIKARKEFTAVHKVLGRLKELSLFAFRNEILPINALEKMHYKFKQVSRDRYLTPPELKLFINWLFTGELMEHVKSYLYLNLLIGNRKMELLAITWDNINIDAGTIFFPKTKNGTDFLITVPPQGIAVLKTMHSIRHGNYLFYSTQSKTGHISSGVIQNQLNKFTAKFGLKHLTIHDLRRTCASTLQELDYTETLTKKILNHKGSDVVTNTYNQSPVEDIRYKALCDLANHYDSLRG